MKPMYCKGAGSCYVKGAIDGKIVHELDDTGIYCTCLSDVKGRVLGRFIVKKLTPEELRALKLQREKTFNVEPNQDYIFTSLASLDRDNMKDWIKQETIINYCQNAFEKLRGAGIYTSKNFLPLEDKKKEIVLAG